MMATPIFNQIAYRIIREQALVIGPLAWDEARKVQGIAITEPKQDGVDLTNGDPKAVVDRLVAQFDRLFGQASHEVSREAVADLIADLPPTEVPQSLQS